MAPSGPGYMIVVLSSVKPALRAGSGRSAPDTGAPRRPVYLGATYSYIYLYIVVVVPINVKEQVKMKNEKFDQAIDEIVGFIVDVQKLQMDQLKNNIKTVYGATIHDTDPHAIAEMIMNTPITPAQPAIHLRDEMVCTAEKRTPYGKAGDLDTLSYVKVGNGAPHGKEFYHHCPEHDNDLVRLHYVKQDGVHACPVCRLVFMQL